MGPCLSAQASPDAPPTPTSSPPPSSPRPRARPSPSPRRTPPRSPWGGWAGSRAGRRGRRSWPPRRGLRSPRRPLEQDGTPSYRQRSAPAASKTRFGSVGSPTASCPRRGGALTISFVSSAALRSCWRRSSRTSAICSFDILLVLFFFGFVREVDQRKLAVVVVRLPSDERQMLAEIVFFIGRRPYAIEKLAGLATVDDEPMGRVTSDQLR